MRIAALILAVLAPLALAVGPARADDPVFLVQYIDVTQAGRDSAAGALHEARALGRKDPGNLSFDVYAESGRATRFVIVSQWRDQKALETYTASPIAKTVRDKLEPVRITPFDERTLTVIAGDKGAVAGRPAADKGAVYVVTHMDSIPPFKDQAAEALKKLADASLGQPGLVRYQVLVQTNRPNHFKLLEVWRDQKAFAAHLAAAPTKQFRDYVQQGAGSPYDERLYRNVP